MTDHTNTYATNDLAFGAFLIATGRLRFRELELSDPRGRARIIFADPSNMGPDLKRQFDAEETFVEPRAFHRHHARRHSAVRPVVYSHGSRAGNG